MSSEIKCDNSKKPKINYVILGRGAVPGLRRREICPPFLYIFFLDTVLLRSTGTLVSGQKSEVSAAAKIIPEVCSGNQVSPGTSGHALQNNVVSKLFQQNSCSQSQAKKEIKAYMIWCFNMH